ncbi:hypothetical protein BaRGS_00007497 [Batillaria attramentaria]|uniref:Anion exchange protein n=1 Tax=Batillaria attramentaria TaxID=370345 RepID=A0ABD0LQV6_9CAEN
MAFHGRDHKKEKHSPEELLPLASSPQSTEEDLVDSINGQSTDRQLLVPHDPTVNGNGLRSILTAPALSVQQSLAPSSVSWDSGADDSLLHPSFSHDDMNKMFEAPRKFSVADLFQGSEVVEAPTEDRRPTKPFHYHVDESDYASHRRFSFPHTHQPLRSMSTKGLQGLSKDSDDMDEDEDGYDEKDGGVMEEVAGEEEEAQFVGSASPSPPPQTVPASVELLSDTERGGAQSPAVGFFLGGDNIQDVITQPEDENGTDKESEAGIPCVPSVAAQTFRLSVSEEPEASPMFGDMSEEPRPSEHAAFLQPPAPGAAPPRASLSQQGSAASNEGLKVKFTVGDASYSNVAKMADQEGEQAGLPHKTDTALSIESTVSTASATSTSSKASTSKPSLHRTGSTDSQKSGRSKHRHHHHPEHFKREDLFMRRQRGSEVHLQDAIARSPTEVEEAALLHKSDLDQMSSHRFADVPGLRRPRIAKRKGTLHSIVHIGKAQKEKRERVKKKQFDHSPHEVFVELDELHMGVDTELEWREKARWIKFEEDVEEGAERWGKPHVASLSFHSLLELRKGLEQGVLLLDLEVSDLPGIVNAVVEKLVVSDLLHEEDRGKLIRTLLLKHKHQHEKSLMKTFSQSSFGSSLGLHKSSSHLSNNEEKKDKHHDKGKAKLEMVKVDVDNNMTDGVHIGLVPLEQQKKHVQDIMRRIPKGSEVSTVLVGQVDYMRKPAMAFVRLAEGQYLENLTEVPLPVRFVFLLLGPEKSGMDYHEVGRSISTLMSNQAFHDVAYQADSRQEMLHAINLFLDDSIVLPPGDWDQKTLLPIMDMARKRAQIRRRKKQKEKEEMLASMGGRRQSVVFRTLDKLSATLQGKLPHDIPVDPLMRTGRPFGGLFNDIKRRYPHYVSDITEAFSVKCLMATIFIFFACISPCIAFGGLLAEKTHGLMGVTETMLCTSLAGMVFSLFSGQPLLLIGATGPVLVFEQSLYGFSESNDIEFLPMRCWIGLWVAVISIIAVAMEASFLIRFVTRFAEEIFAILISIIFIYEVVKKLVHTFEVHPLVHSYNCDINDTDIAVNISTNNSLLNGSMVGDNSTSFSGYSLGPAYMNFTHEPLDTHGYGYDEQVMQPNTALLSLILTLGTFLIAYFLRIFRNSKFLGRSVRRALGDFGVLIALLTMSVLDYLMKDTYTKKLSIQDSFSPTSPGKRDWFINPMGVKKPMEIWVIFAAIIPAFLIFTLLFLEVQITEMILNKKERKLKKGCGFHLDQLIMGLLTFLCSLFGLPWMCAATVRTMAHVSALSSYSRTHAPGEKPHLLGVKEQRLTNFIVHCLIGLSLLLGPVLRAIPVMALFGVFLYLGFSAMSGVQMFERIKLLLMPVKYHPSVGYVRRVHVTKMHLFTVIQLLCLILLLIIKSTQAALAFPFALILLIPVRLKILNRFFTEQELHELDKEEEDSELEDEDDPDFYQMAHMPI